ncbi:MAG: ATP-grasp domain-containing protein [Candidatus Asgardarchaeia archaeon]
MLSNTGGVDIENKTKFVSVVKVDPLLNLQSYHLKVLLNQFSFEPLLQKNLEELLTSVYNIFLKTNANIVEINPLGVIGSNLYALDAKIIIDDSSIYDNSINKSDNGESSNFTEVLNRFGLYGGIWDGDIAVLCGGAGRMMAILDLIINQGGTIRAFGELGTSVSQKSFLELAMSKLLPALYNLNPKVIFFNAFFVLAKCEDFANALVKAFNQSKFTNKPIPIIVRLEGNGEKIAREILKNSSTDILLENDLIKATKKTLVFGKGGINGNFNK